MERILVEEIKRQIRDSIETRNALLSDPEILHAIQNAAELCIKAIKDHKKILLAGNGGSAADAQHIAGELVNRFMFDRPAIAAISLSTDTSVLTSISNDIDFNNVFSRQIEAIGNEGDVFIALSTSGNSENIIKGLETAQLKDIRTIGFTGFNECKMSVMCDILLRSPSQSTPRIQEVHILMGHIICTLIESELYK